jgi:hypothetical protein
VFFLEDNPLPFDLIDIPIGTNVFRLKAAIKQRVKNSCDVDADKLELWKVVSLVLGVCAF